MAVDKAELEALREEALQTPEGSVARRLLALVDEDIQEQVDLDRKRILYKLMHEHGHSPEEAEQMYAGWKSGLPIETEWVKCPDCQGFLVEVGLGNGCYRCQGSGKILRYINPYSK